MKQKRFLKSPSSYGAFTLIIVSLLTLSSCGMFKSGNSQTTTAKGKVPTSYNKPIPGAPATPNEAARMGYIERFKRIAISEMERTGVPASIKLAQGLLESNAGRSTLSGTYNNHFGIKCHSDWQGERYYQEDDDKDPLTGQLIKSCFRVYKNPDESFIAHSEFLRDPRKVNRYGFLFQLPRTDYVAWAEGLERAGYATATDYNEKLVRLIEDYQLAQYDNYSLKDVIAAGPNGAPVNGGAVIRPNDDFPTSGFPSNGKPQGNTQQPPVNNNSWLPGWDNANATDNPTSTPVKQEDTEGVRNNTKYARAYGGMTPYELAGKYGISIGNLQAYNEEIVEPRTALPEGTVVYLQKKRNYWTGKEKTYRVKDCETMYDISQKFGIKLSKLYAKNEMRQGEQPAIGQIVMLRRGWFEGADKPALRDTFGEWRRCKMPEPTTNPNVTNNTNPRPTPSNGSDMGIEIVPSGSNPNSGQPYYPPTTTTYPGTDVTTSYPPTTTTYPQTTTTYPSNTYPSNTYPTTTYPSNTYPTTTYPSNTYPSTTTPSRPPATKPSAPKPQAPPAGKPTTTATKPQAPPAGKPTTTPAKPQPAATGGVQYHTVEVKQTLWAISRLYGTTVDKLKELNNLPDNNIQPGQQLRVK